MNNVVERIWKETVVAQFKVPSRNSLGGPEENRKKSVRIAGLLAEI
jgi:hypothetical protein